MTAPFDRAELIALLRQQAQEIAAADHNGWGNTMRDAADEIERLQRGEFICKRCGLRTARRNAKPSRSAGDGEKG